MDYIFAEDVIHTSFLAMAKESAYTYENKDVVKFQTVKHSVAPPNFGYDSMLSFYRQVFLKKRVPV